MRVPYDMDFDEPWRKSQDQQFSNLTQYVNDKSKPPLSYIASVQVKDSDVKDSNPLVPIAVATVSVVVGATVSALAGYAAGGASAVTPASFVGTALVSIFSLKYVANRMHQDAYDAASSPLFKAIQEDLSERRANSSLWDKLMVAINPFNSNKEQAHDQAYAILHDGQKELQEEASRASMRQRG